MKNWYQKLMPTIKDVKPFIKSVAKELNELKDVQSVMVWGEYSSNVNKLSHSIREIDFIIKTSFHSDDLLAITSEDEFSTLKMSSDELEMMGYDIDSINFTKKIKKQTKFPSNFWVTSKNKKLLHWGPIVEQHDEWIELQDLAEKYANENTNIKSIIKQSQNTKDNWYEYYTSFLNNYVDDMPEGWYISKTDLNSVLSSGILV